MVPRSTNTRKPPRQQPRPARPPRALPHSQPTKHPLLQAQQQAGNQAVQQLFRSGILQAKLTVSKPGDSAEREAEQIADAITHPLYGSPVSSTGAGQSCAQCSVPVGGSALLRTAAAAGSRPASPSASRAVKHLLASSGRPLDGPSRAFFEPRFGNDLSSVRIHSGVEAAESARAIEARAYTFGTDIVFNHGEYEPASNAGQHLLAHELTHVLQQSSGSIHSAALQRQADPAPKTLKEEAQDLIDGYTLIMAQFDDFTGIAHELDFALLALRYAFVLQVFEELSAGFEDNVAAELISVTSTQRLHLYALSPEGRKMLNILYQAIITGHVTDFEREQATRILDANKLSQGSYTSQAEGNMLVFPVRNQGFTRNCYATFHAELQSNGNIKVWYTSVRVTECDMFKADVATFPDHDPTRAREIRPDTLVDVHLYDEGGIIIPVPAIALIDYANQSQNKTLSLAATAFVTGFTLGYGGLGAGALTEGRAGLAAAKEAGEGIWAARAMLLGARALFLADTAGLILPVLTDIVEENRDWIVENVPYGEEVISGIEKANAIIAYYGYARLGFDGLRFAGSQFKSVLKARAAGGVPHGLNAEEQAVLRKIDDSSSQMLASIEETERALQSATPPAPQPVAPSGGGAGAAIPHPNVPPPLPAAHATPSPPAATHAAAGTPHPTAAPTAPAPHTAAPSVPVHTTAPSAATPHAPPAPHPAQAPPHEHITEPVHPDPHSTAKPGDFSPAQIEDAGKKLEQHLADPASVHRPKPDSEFELEVDLGDGQTFRERSDGSWCLFRNPRECGIQPNKKIADAAGKKIAQFHTEEFVDRALEQLSNTHIIDPTKISQLRKYLREHPEELHNILDQQPYAPQHYGTEDMPERGDARYGGSAPGEAGKLGKDLSRRLAREMYGVPKIDPWIADELHFSFRTKDGTKLTTIADIGVRAPDQSGLLIDSKLGAGSGEEFNQTLGYPAIVRGEAIPVGPNAEKFAQTIFPNWKAGTAMPSVKVEIYNWAKTKAGGHYMDPKSWELKSKESVKP